MKTPIEGGATHPIETPEGMEPRQFDEDDDEAEELDSTASNCGNIFLHALLPHVDEPMGRSL